MIGWGRVAIHAIWIFGLATALASWSWRRCVRFGVPNSKEGAAVTELASAGLAFAAVGVGLIVDSWWLRLGWAVCASAYAVEAYRQWQKK